MIELIEAKSMNDFKTAIQLFQEYASQIGVDLEFQHFSKELETIEEHYSRPNGVLILARNRESAPLGCFAIRALKSSICELKRMYVREEFRGLGLGKQMLVKSIEIGKKLGYKKMRLDTLPTMGSAIALYQKMGFCQIEAYRFNPVKGTKYFEIKLTE